MAGKVSLKIEVAGVCASPRRRALAALDRDHFLEQTHRRLVREAIDQGHRRVV